MKQKRILYICTACPYGETYGMGLRTRHIAKQLEKFGQVDVIAIAKRQWTEEELRLTRENLNLLRFIQPKESKLSTWEKIRGELNPKFLNTHSLHLTTEDRAFIDEQMAKSDVTWVHTIKLANIVGRFHWPKTVIDVDDYPSQFCATVIRNSKKTRDILKNARLYLKWKIREKALLKRFSSVVVCKDADRGAFGDAHRTHAVANGFERFPLLRDVDTATRPRLGIIGNFNYRLNIDAVIWFKEHVWPVVRKAVPQVRLRLVGRGGEKYAQDDLAIDALGFVDDPALELGSWSALVAPTRMGGGTSVKIAEAFSRRLPVIASSHGARGYAVTADKELLVADDPHAFAQACINLLQDKSLGERLAAAAGDYFESHLAWDTMAPHIEKALAQAQSL